MLCDFYDISTYVASEAAMQLADIGQVPLAIVAVAAWFVLSHLQASQGSATSFETDLAEIDAGGEIAIWGQRYLDGLLLKYDFDTWSVQVIEGPIGTIGHLENIDALVSDFLANQE